MTVAGLLTSWNLEPAAYEISSIAQVAADISKFASRCGDALQTGDAPVAVWELSQCLPSIGRAVVQIHVGAEMFHEFFNSSAGYRAMFRLGPRVGCAANATIVCSVRDALSGKLPNSLHAHVIALGDDGPRHAGRQVLDRATFLRSLDPSLAKVWYSTAVVGADGSIRRLPFGVSEDKIDVGLPNPWAAICQSPADCVLELNGAFVGPCGLFQGKDPEQRARTLAARGEA